MAKPLGADFDCTVGTSRRTIRGQRYRECIRCGAISGGSSALPGGGFGGY
jgi:hypothetical protein